VNRLDAARATTAAANHLSYTEEVQSVPTCILTESDITAGHDEDCTLHSYEEAP
jgi:hypothetical protein